MQPLWQTFYKGRIIKWHLSSLFVRCRQHWIVFMVVLLTCIVVYQELICYHFASWHWYHLKPREKSSRFLKVLIVADPQLQGYEDEPPLLGYVTRFDADRYLAKTFRVAFDFVKPDMIIFLGDLLDEGSKANREDFFKSVKRFYSTFRVPSDVLQLYVPGDNDVGGEGSEAFSNDKQTRFQTAFNSNDQFKNAVFYFMNFVEGNLMNGHYKAINQVSAKNSQSTVDILVSHVPLLGSHNLNARDMLASVQPNLILSAHDHKATLVKTNSPTQPDSVISLRIKPNDSPLYLLLSHQMTFELLSPTCSYRMGVPIMGYGSLLIEQLKDLDVVVQYAVLWNPQRYPQLYLYLFILIIICVFVLVKVLKYSMNSRRFLQSKN